MTTPATNTPNYGLISHQLLNLLMALLNMILDIPTMQSAGTTNEEHPTDKAYEDARLGMALCKKYGFHMIRHPFSFLRLLVDFSIEKLEKCRIVTGGILNRGLQQYFEDYETSLIKISGHGGP